MKRMLLAVLLLCPATAQAQLRGLPDGGAAEFRQKQMQEYAESERQEKWMWLVGLIAAAGLGVYLWQQNQKGQKQ